MTRQLTHLVMESVQGASVQRKAICLLVLTQALVVFRDALADSCFSLIADNNGVLFRLPDQTIHLELILDVRLRGIWLYLRKQLVSLYKEARMSEVDVLNRSYYGAKSIIQEQIRKFYLSQKFRVRDEFKYLLEGKSKMALDSMKARLEDSINSASFSRRKVNRLSVFILNALVANGDWLGLAHFLLWYFQKVFAYCGRSSKKNAHSVSASLQGIFIKLLGNLGILLAKLCFKVPIYIPNSFGYYKYLSILDNPPKGQCKKVVFLHFV